MITQSQYFVIEEYLQQECRIIEPELLEEMIDHFMDGIEAAKQFDEDFIAAFEVVKEGFGRKSGVRKIQRAWQANAIRVHTKGIAQELQSYFQKPYLWFTSLYIGLSAYVIFYFKLRLLHFGESDFWDGMLQGGVGSGLLLLSLFIIINKFELGTFKPQARNWVSFLCILLLVFQLIAGVGLLGFFASGYLPQLITLVVFITNTLTYLAIFRYSNRDLYSDYYWT